MTWWYERFKIQTSVSIEHSGMADEPMSHHAFPLGRRTDHFNIDCEGCEWGPRRIIWKWTCHKFSMKCTEWVWRHEQVLWGFAPSRLRNLSQRTEYPMARGWCVVCGIFVSQASEEIFPVRANILLNKASGGFKSFGLFVLLFTAVLLLYCVWQANTTQP